MSFVARASRRFRLATKGFFRAYAAFTYDVQNWMKKLGTTLFAAELKTNMPLIPQHSL